MNSDDRLRELVTVVASYQRAHHGHSPSVREIALAMSLTSGTVQLYVTRCLEDGLLVRDAGPHQARGLRLPLGTPVERERDQLKAIIAKLSNPCVSCGTVSGQHTEMCDLDAIVNP